MSSGAYSNANTHSNHFSARRLSILWDIPKPRVEIVSPPEQPRVIQSIVVLPPMVVSPSLRKSRVNECHGWMATYSMTQERVVLFRETV
jgi:hypothetical protein